MTREILLNITEEIYSVICFGLIILSAFTNTTVKCI